MPGLPQNKVHHTGRGWAPLLVWAGSPLPLGEIQGEAEAQACYDLGKMLFLLSRGAQQGQLEGLKLHRPAAFYTTHPAWQQLAERPFDEACSLLASGAAAALLQVPPPAAAAPQTEEEAAAIESPAARQQAAASHDEPVAMRPAGSSELAPEAGLPAEPACACMAQPEAALSAAGEQEAAATGAVVTAGGEEGEEEAAVASPAAAPAGQQAEAATADTMATAVAEEELEAGGAYQLAPSMPADEHHCAPMGVCSGQGMPPLQDSAAPTQQRAAEEEEPEEGDDEELLSWLQCDVCGKWRVVTEECQRAFKDVPACCSSFARPAGCGPAACSCQRPCAGCHSSLCSCDWQEEEGEGKQTQQAQQQGEGPVLLQEQQAQHAEQARRAQQHGLPPQPAEHPAASTSASSPQAKRARLEAGMGAAGLGPEAHQFGSAAAVVPRRQRGSPRTSKYIGVRLLPSGLLGADLQDRWAWRYNLGTFPTEDEGQALPLGEHESEAEAQACYDLGKMLSRGKQQRRQRQQLTLPQRQRMQQQQQQQQQ
ncbi:hypothetical protein ABPG75_002875 [Micractinium tetrahymenae]